MMKSLALPWLPLLMEYFGSLKSSCWEDSNGLDSVSYGHGEPGAV
jgi:hypothetical protein